MKVGLYYIVCELRFTCHGEICEQMCSDLQSLIQGFLSRVVARVCREIMDLLNSFEKNRNQEHIELATTPERYVWRLRVHEK